MTAGQVLLPGQGWIDDGTPLGQFLLPGTGWYSGDQAGGTSVTARGSIATINLTAPAGDAIATQDATGAGAIGTIALTAPVGHVLSPSVRVGGPIGSIFLTAPRGGASAGPDVSVGGPIGVIRLSAPAGGALLTGTIYVTEADVAVLASPASSGQVAELDVAALATPSGLTTAQIAELDASAVVRPTSQTGAQIAEVDIAALIYAGPCATRRATCWKLTRTDGVVFAYTSASSDLTFMGVVYKTCKSLAQSATESSSNLGQVGNVEINGMLSSSDITEEDLYAGLFDDCYVEVWVVPWDGQPDDQAPMRIAAGYSGKTTRQEHAWKSDVLGPGARLQQTSLVDFFTPGCAWDFGVLDAKGVGCPVDAEALKLAAVPVTGQKQRTLIFFNHAAPGGSATWSNGKVRWLTGRNAGVVCQVNTVDFSAEALQLWDLAPYPPQVGDTFDLLPGCDKTEAACKNYGVYVSFGGFSNVPGPDALQSNADSLFTGN